MICYTYSKREAIQMKILPIIASNHLGKNLVNFKADVTILPNTAKGNQPTEDKFILEDETKKIQKELQKRFPSKNDNIQIFLQPNGFRSSYDKKLYWNRITAYMGYKDSERARQEIIQKNITPPNDDYVLLEKETIQKLNNKEHSIMKKLEDRLDYCSEYYIKEDIPKISSELIDNVEYAIENSLDYALTEYEKPPIIPPSPTDDNIDIQLPNWL